MSLVGNESSNRTKWVWTRRQIDGQVLKLNAGLCSSTRAAHVQLFFSGG